MEECWWVMSKVKRSGWHGERWDVRDSKCMGRSCFSPGAYYHTAPIPGNGRRTTGATSMCCLTRANHGCGNCEYNTATKKWHQDEGWSNA